MRNKCQLALFIFSTLYASEVATEGESTDLVALTLENPIFTDKLFHVEDRLKRPEEFHPEKALDEEENDSEPEKYTYAKSFSNVYPSFGVNIVGAASIDHVKVSPRWFEDESNYTVYDALSVEVSSSGFGAPEECTKQDDQSSATDGYPIYTFDCPSLNITKPSYILIKSNKLAHLSIANVEAYGTAVDENDPVDSFMDDLPDYFTQLELVNAKFPTENGEEGHYKTWWYDCSADKAIDGNWFGHDPYKGFALSASGVDAKFTVEFANKDKIALVKQVVIYPRKYVDGCCGDFLRQMKVELEFTDSASTHVKRCESQQDLTDSNEFVTGWFRVFRSGLFFDCDGNGTPNKIIVTATHEEQNRLAIAEIMAFGKLEDGATGNSTTNARRLALDELQLQYANATKNETILNLRNPFFSDEQFSTSSPFYCPPSKAVDAVTDSDHQLNDFAMSLTTNPTNFTVDIDYSEFYKEITQVRVFPRKYINCCHDYYDNMQVFIGRKGRGEAECVKDDSYDGNNEDGIIYNCNSKGYYIKLQLNKEDVQFSISEVLAFGIEDQEYIDYLTRIGIPEEDQRKHKRHREVDLKNPKGRSPFDDPDDDEEDSESDNGSVVQSANGEQDDDDIEFLVEVHNPQIYERLNYVLVFPSAIVFENDPTTFADLEVSVERKSDHLRTKDCIKLQTTATFRNESEMYDEGVPFRHYLQKGFAFNCTSVGSEAYNIVVTGRYASHLAKTHAVGSVRAFGTEKKTACCNDVDKTCCFKLGDRYSFTNVFDEPTYSTSDQANNWKAFV